MEWLWYLLLFGGLMFVMNRMGISCCGGGASCGNDRPAKPEKSEDSSQPLAATKTAEPGLESQNPEARGAGAKL